MAGNRPISLYHVAGNRPIAVYRFPCRALTHCPQLCMDSQPGARFPPRSADAWSATLYGHFTQPMYRNRPISGRPHREVTADLQRALLQQHRARGDLTHGRVAPPAALEGRNGDVGVQGLYQPAGRDKQNILPATSSTRILLFPSFIESGGIL